MRKRIISHESQNTVAPDAEWLDLEAIAQVEITSEDVAFPIEGALTSADNSQPWRAAASGKQTIRLVFDRPQQLKRIWLKFVEPDVSRTQEYVLRWSSDAGQSFQTILRQQWNFSSECSTVEVEDHQVDLDSVTVLELTIVPDISGGDAIASLAQLRLA
ncbi:MAG: carbohydrate-binding protein [Chromatiales bacterium]|jgi:hypothetical protein